MWVENETLSFDWLFSGLGDSDVDESAVDQGLGLVDECQCGCLRVAQIQIPGSRASANLVSEH